MKKVRIELKPGRCRRYHLFDSVEALYIWLADGVTLDDFIADNPDYVTIIDLDVDGQFLEVEWLGAEFTRNGVLHYVRMARATPHDDGVGFRLAIYVGWIHNDYLRFNTAEDFDISVMRVDSFGEIDMERIFSVPKRVEGG